MGKVQQGILDGFIGKVGTVVGAFWKGKPVMRAYKRQIRDANSEDQQLIRIRFSAAGRIAAAFRTALLVGFRSLAQSNRMTEGNVFVKLNWGHVHADISGSATVDYEDLVIAQGGLPEIQFGNATFENPLQVDVPINDSASVIGSHRDDTAYVFVYSPEAGAGILSDTGVRVDEEVSIHVPAYWNGHRVHVFGFGKGSESNDLNPGTVSNSRYLGSGTIS